MAIKINSGTPPQLGRITMPKGTYLSNQPKFDNPGGSADGSLGGSYGMWQGVTPGYNNALAGNTNFNNSKNPFTNPYGIQLNPYSSYEHQIPNNPNALNDFITKLFTPYSQQQTEQVLGKGGSWMVNTMNSALSPQSQPTNAFNTSPNAPTNQFVGNDILSAPQQLTARQAQSMTGLTGDALVQWLAANGYGARTYVAGVGEVFQQTGQKNPNAQQGFANGGYGTYGNPSTVDPTSLAPGERARDANGLYYAGGTPYTDNAGTTVSQYAVTIPGVQDDPKGAYKWTKTTKKDASGNWVAVYSQKLRKVYAKGAAERREQRSEQAVAPVQDAPQNTADFNQLVTLRAAYG